MEWKRVRLELAPTPDFPLGSASRAYLIRLPVNDDGLVDEAKLGAGRDRARVHRFWPSQPDMSGSLVRTSEGWAISYRRPAGTIDAAIRLDARQLRIGEEVILTEPDGRQLPYRVVSLT